MARRQNVFKHFRCRRCGGCCSDVGQNFWRHSEHPLVNRLAEAVEAGPECDDGGPCLMLIVENGRATCLLQKYLGRAAKPEACRDYPSEGEACRREELKVSRAWAFLTADSETPKV